MAMQIRSALAGAGATVLVGAGVFVAVATSNAAEQPETVVTESPEPGRYSTLESADPNVWYEPREVVLPEPEPEVEPEPVAPAPEPVVEEESVNEPEQTEPVIVEQPERDPSGPNPNDSRNPDAPPMAEENGAAGPSDPVAPETAAP